MVGRPLNKNCTLCRLSETRNLVVGGQGPKKCAIMMIAEAPGEFEDRHGTPFHPSAAGGAELDHILNINSCPRENVYLTNSIKCRPPGNRNPRKDEIDACSAYLDYEIDRVDPQIIATIGGFSTRRVLGDVDMETVHGIPFQKNGRIVVPLYHVAAGLRDNKTMLNVYADFKSLFGIIRQERPSRHIEDPFAGKERYIRCRTAGDVLSAVGNRSTIAVDVEWNTNNNELWCITFSVEPGTSNMIMREDTEAIWALDMFVSSPNIVSIIHNTLSDLGILESVGIHPARPFDTMIVAYLLQNEPQGLKPLAFRHCGMKMGSYAEAVAPATYFKAIDYLHKVVERKWPKPDPVLEFVQGVPKKRQPQDIGRKTSGILRDMVSPKKGDIDPRKRWLNFDPRERKMVEDELGVMEEGFLGDIDPEEAKTYACSDADATIRIYPIMKRRIEAEEMVGTFERDMRAVPMVADMMKYGILTNPQHFVEFGAYLQSKEDELQSRISAEAGWDVNPGSPLQMQKLLYDQLDLPRYKKTDTGWSTDEKVLARLADKHPIVQMVRDYRSYNKLRTSYAEVIPKVVDKHNRVRSNLRVTRTDTGRLSSGEPVNLMAQPVRSEEGLKIKRGYIASPGCHLVEIDYSQADMRCCAHGSGDERMLHIFRSGLDIHSQTASAMFKLPINQLDEMKHRYPAKRVGFGVLNDISAKGLQREMIVGGAKEKDWPLWLCQDLINKWFETYSGVARFVNRTRAEARRYGYVTDMWGRRRYIPGIRSSSRSAVAEAERQATNAPFQMGTAGITKEAMGRLVPVYRGYIDDGYVCYPLIQVHDSLLFEIQDEILDEVVPRFMEIMEGVAPFMKVPLKVDAKIGLNWGETEKWKYGG